MLAVRADLALDGPGVSVRVHGDGPVLIADVRGDRRAVARTLRDIPGLIRGARTLSRALRVTGVRLAVRVGGRTILRLG